MSKAIKDGGPAFPGTEANGLNSGVAGMTLRDYFAAKAMQGFASHDPGGFPDGCDEMAAWAYKWADAMLEARGAK